MHILTRIGLCTIFPVLFVSLSWAQTDIQSKEKLCRDYQIRMENHVRDFLQFADVQNKNGFTLEGEIANHLREIASQEEDYLGAVMELLFVYRVITKADRMAVKPSIKVEFEHYIKLTELTIEGVNNWALAYTKNPAIAASGTRLKEDLREIKTFLDSIDLP